MINFNKTGIPTNINEIEAGFGINVNEALVAAGIAFPEDVEEAIENGSIKLNHVVVVKGTVIDKGENLLQTEDMFAIINVLENDN